MKRISTPHAANPYKSPVRLALANTDDGAPVLNTVRGKADGEIAFDVRNSSGRALAFQKGGRFFLDLRALAPHEQVETLLKRITVQSAHWKPSTGLGDFHPIIQFDWQGTGPAGLAPGETLRLAVLRASGLVLAPVSAANVPFDFAPDGWTASEGNAPTTAFLTIVRPDVEVPIIAMIRDDQAVYTNPTGGPAVSNEVTLDILGPVNSLLIDASHDWGDTPPTFEIEFQAGEGETDLAGTQQLGSIVVKDPIGPWRAAKSVNTPVTYWIVTPVDYEAYKAFAKSHATAPISLKISGIAPAMAGTTHVAVRYRNLPGFEDGRVSARLRKADPLPNVIDFAATPKSLKSGANIELTWQSRFATESKLTYMCDGVEQALEIKQGDRGSVKVAPGRNLEPILFTLTAANRLGSATRQLTVAQSAPVPAPPKKAIIKYFRLNRNHEDWPDFPVTLTAEWSVSGAKWILVDSVPVDNPVDGQYIVMTEPRPIVLIACGEDGAIVHQEARLTPSADMDPHWKTRLANKKYRTGDGSTKIYSKNYGVSANFTEGSVCDLNIEFQSSSSNAACVFGKIWLSFEFMGTEQKLSWNIVAIFRGYPDGRRLDRFYMSIVKLPGNDPDTSTSDFLPHILYVDEYHIQSLTDFFLGSVKVTYGRSSMTTLDLLLPRTRLFS